MARKKSDATATNLREVLTMRWCRYEHDQAEHLGFDFYDHVIPLRPVVDAAATALRFESPANLDVRSLVDLEAGVLPILRMSYIWLQASPIAARWAVPVDKIRRLAPIPKPGKILCLAGNYAKHVEERGGVAAEREETFPYVFLKPTTTIANPEDPIVLPACSPDHIDWECELGVIMGRPCRNVDEADALRYVSGYTVVNDVSDREFTPNPARKPRERDKFFDWLHGKWHDTFCPMGPCVLTIDDLHDPRGFGISLKVNGERMQNGSTAAMVFPVAAVIAFLSSWMTLEPGDVISTGTPAGVGSARGRYLRPGDVVEASISGIGTLRNPVVASSMDRQPVEITH